MQLAQQGDGRAYDAFLKSLATIAKAVVTRKIGKQGDVEDVVQEIILSVHKARHTYDPARPIMPWLGSIIHYRLTDWMRSHYARQEQKHVPIDEVLAFLAMDVTDHVAENEYIHKAMEMLNATQQRVLEAMYMQDLSVAQTAQKLNMSVSAVKVTAHRAYKKLRESLEQS